MASIITPIDNAPNARDLTTESFDAWNEALDNALATLPEMMNIPHRLYRLIARSTDGPQKRFVLLSQKSRPVAIVGLRRAGRHWEQIGHGVLPGTVVPALEGFAVPALVRTGLDIWIGAVDSAPDPPTGRGVRDAYSIPTFGVDCRADFEGYWRESGLWGVIKPARRRTKNYTFEVDTPEAPRWIIDRWADKWRSGQTDSKDDLRIAYDYFPSHGQSHSFRLLLDGTPVAGTTFFVDSGRRLILQTTFYDDAYRKEGVGTRLLDLVFAWAAESPYEELDLGGGHEYKNMWAPERGRLWAYHVCPLHNHVERRVMDFGRALKTKIFSHGHGRVEAGGAMLRTTPTGGTA